MNFSHLCRTHSNEELKFICLNQHQCQRTLCAECFEEHQAQYPDSQCTTIKKFLEKSNQNFKFLNNSDSFSFSYKELQKNLSEIEYSYNHLFQNIKQNLDILFGNLSDSKLNISVIKEKLTEFNIDIFTNKELDFLVKGELYDQISLFNQFEQYCMDQLDNRFNQLLELLKEFHKEIQQKVYQNNVIIDQQKIYEEPNKNNREIGKIVLVGQEILGMIHGECQYEIYLHDKELRKAGMHHFGKKCGYWRETQYNIQSEGEYLYGVQIGNWKFINDCEILAECEFNEHGQKIGIWKEIFSYNDQQLIVQEGQYVNNEKIDQWNTFYRKQPQAEWQLIGSGNYDKKGKKVGKWIDIDTSSYGDSKQIIQEGYYYQENLRVGEWKLLFRDDKSQNFSQIGKGEYDLKGLKTGIWFEFDENYFFINAQVIMEGSYLSGMKIGKWRILFRDDSSTEFQEIGSGHYNDSGNKIGEWVELDEKNFTKQFQVIQQGYYENGNKVGNWKLLFRDDNTQNFIQIGYGEYSSSGQKQGQWREIVNNCAQVIWEGEYQNNLRIGEWKLFHRYDSSSEFQQIGGGWYDQNGKKIGDWRDIDQSIFSNTQQIIWQGKYQLGVKIDDWKILFRDDNTFEFKQIGGGYFNQIGQKNGQWKDINENYFKDTSQILWEGYYEEGLRIGEWNLFYRDDSQTDFQEIGGGFYNNFGQKSGQWKIVNDRYFRDIQQIIWEGQYEDDVKIGEWKILHRQDSTQDFHKIGGGYFNDSKKIGNWIDVHENYYSNSQQIVWDGYYKGGLRVGDWMIFYRENSQSTFEQIGGGLLNQKGIKINFWKEINESQFNIFQQIVWEGCYTEGIKVGQWEIYFRGYNCPVFKQIGGGSYNKGQKDGKWRDIKESLFDYSQQIVWEGYYISGIKVGEWCIFFREDSMSEFQQIGGGQYNEQGQKIGIWNDLEYDWSIKIIERDYNSKKQ